MTERNEKEFMKQNASLSSEEIAELIEKARAVKDMGGLGSERVYRLIKRYFTPTVVGLENIPKENTLFVGNHGGFGLDGFLICPILYHEAGRFVRAMGDNALLRRKWDVALMRLRKRLQEAAGVIFRDSA